MSRPNSQGIEMRHPGGWYVVQRPNGRTSRRMFKSAFRAAEHAMRAFKVDNWTLLRDRGFRVVGTYALPQPTRYHSLHTKEIEVIEEAGMEMPRYKCHKEVWALKIEAIQRIPSGNATVQHFLVPEDKRYAPFEVGLEYIGKHSPAVGGYYVVYDDGYKSYSPAKAFEDGYSLVST